MSRLPQFARYAAAFEKSVATDDWSLVEPFFAEDAVYTVGFGPPLGGTFQGRDAILAYFKAVLDRFDRRFDTRAIALLEDPKDDGESIWFRGSATYGKQGLPDLVLELEETIRFDGDLIVRLEDYYDDAMERQIVGYLTQHGELLGISLDEPIG